MKKIKSISDAKLAANRANAKKSTGPKTPEGKAISSQNAVKHALTAKDTTILGEDYNHFTDLRDALLATHQPANAHESQLIERIAVLQARLNRCVRMETGLLDMDIPDVKKENTKETCNSAAGMAFVKMERSFMNLSRYEAQIARQYDQAFKQFLALRKEQPTPPNQTKPTFIENKDRAEGEEANHRFELDPPMQPEEAQNRRLGKYIPFPEPPPIVKKPPVLIWVDNDGNQWMRTDGKPLKQADGTYKENWQKPPKPITGPQQ